MDLKLDLSNVERSTRQSTHFNVIWKNTRHSQTDGMSTLMHWSVLTSLRWVSENTIHPLKLMHFRKCMGNFLSFTLVAVVRFGPWQVRIYHVDGGPSQVIIYRGYWSIQHLFLKKTLGMHYAMYRPTNRRRRSRSGLSELLRCRLPF